MGILEDMIQQIQNNSILKTEKLKQELYDIANSTQDQRALCYAYFVDCEMQYFSAAPLNTVYQNALKTLDLAIAVQDAWVNGSTRNILGNLLRGHSDLTSYGYYWGAYTLFKEQNLKGNYLYFRIKINMATSLLNENEFEDAVAEYEFIEEELLNNKEFAFKQYDLFAITINKMNCFYKLKRYDQLFCEYQKAEDLIPVVLRGINNEQEWLYALGALLIWEFISNVLKNRHKNVEKDLLHLLQEANRASLLSYFELLGELLIEQGDASLFLIFYDFMYEQVRKQGNIKSVLRLLKLKFSFYQQFGEGEDYLTECREYARLSIQYDQMNKQQMALSLKSYIEICKKDEERRELKKSKEILLRQSRHDELTGLCNRYELNEFCNTHLKTACQQKKSIAVIILDIDYFKQINDQFGHTQGDFYLKQIAEVIKSAITHDLDAQEFAARYGGDEFLLIQIGKTDKEIMSFMENIRLEVMRLALPNPLSKCHTIVTVSQGAVNKIPAPEDDLQSYITLADQALYQAKQHCKNQVILA